MSFVTTTDGTQIFYKDWRPKDAQAIVFHHGWPLSADDWDAQMMFFVSHGFRVIAHDRRGHGRSSQTSDGNEMDTYAQDVSSLTDHLGLQGAIHIGHSTGGGEVAHYVARAMPGRVSKAVLIGAVTPLMLRPKAIRAACRWRSSTACEPCSSPTAPNSTSIFRAGLSTASTVRPLGSAKA